jgi:hypothetical protein
VLRQRAVRLFCDGDHIGALSRERADARGCRNADGIGLMVSDLTTDAIYLRGVEEAARCAVNNVIGMP